MQKEPAVHEWEPIADLPEGWEDLRRDDLHLVHQQWIEEKSILKDPRKVEKLQERLATEWAIETGIIERLYTVERGVTETLIELGLEAVSQFHASGAISRDAMRLIFDQRAALEFVFQFIRQERPLSTSYIKELHQLLTRNQLKSEAVDQFGTKLEVELLRGEWKRLPNNPTLPDGRVHEYCPPEFVQDEIDQLLKWHAEHQKLNIDVEMEAAWIHHRITQIHPFQDGNGRVARALATMVFLRQDYLPLVIRDVEHRETYLNALEMADVGGLKVLVNIFAEIQLKDLAGAIDFLRELRGEGVARIAASAAERVKLRQQETEDEAQQLTDQLVGVAMTRLEETSSELDLQFRREGMQIDATVFRSVPDTETWWNYQIVETARHHGYWADLSRFRAWIQLRLRLPELGQTQASIIISLHHGARVAGLMTATAFLTTATSAEAGTDSREEWEVIPATDRPFAYSTSHRDPESGFRVWLDEAVEVALDKWQARI